MFMYAVIMAGGVGTRFWPRSRLKQPKQLLKILDDKTMIQATVHRLDKIISKDQIYIVATESQMEEIKKQLPFLKQENLIVEPKGKSTAPCIGLTAIILKQRDPEAVMAVLPADHRIRNEELFRKVLSAAEIVASKRNCLVTIGIHPTYPSTGYGYIQVNGKVDEVNDIDVFKVKTFAEKPDLTTAQRFLTSGDFLWNSGMFVWKVNVILEEIEESLPELYDGLLEIERYLGTASQDEVIKKVYCQIKSISIDYGVMEQSENVYVLKGEFDWNDVGSWEEIYKMSPHNEENNVIIGNHFTKDTKGCLIDSSDRFIATLGVDNLIIIDTDDALLVCRRDMAQNVKDLVDAMKRKNLNQYL
ncbi:MAG: mannose-1-phosphate guanylyltransferase [bacterium]|nr:MAG: mannose-1-phosphate guanylyltransferase [bacterium]